MPTGTPEQQAIGKLVTDATAAVLDERYQSSTDPTYRGFIDSLTDRLATQYHNVPGYDATEFRDRATKGKRADAALAAVKAAKPIPTPFIVPASAASSPAKPSAPFDAAARHRELLAQQAAQAAAKK